MSETEIVKIEVELHKNIHDALMYLCQRFEYEGNEFVNNALRGEISGLLCNNFESISDRVKSRVEAILER